MHLPFIGHYWKELTAAFILVAVLTYVAYRVIEYFRREPRCLFSFRSILGLSLLFGLGLCSYFMTGEILGGDAHSHTARTWLFADILSKGELPIWTNKWYLGYPIGLYYGFLYYFLTGTMAALSGISPLLITKVFLITCHIASGFALFYLAFLCCNNRKAALFASLFYVYSFQHTGSLVLAGALPLALIFLLLPLLFATLERVHEYPSCNLWGSSIRAAALASCLLFTHIQYGFYTVLCFCLVSLVRVVILFFRRDNMSAWAITKFLCLTGAATLIFSGWFLVPLVVEKQHLLLSSQNTLRSLTGNFSWQKLIYAAQRIVTPSRSMAWTFFYFGCVPLTLSLLGSLGLFSQRRRTNSRYASYTIAFIIGLPLALSSRYINIWFFLACLMSAWGVEFVLNSKVLKRLPCSLKNHAFLILVILLLIDCGISLVQLSYKRLPAFDNLDNAVNAGRLAVLHKSRATLWTSLEVIVTGRSSIFGGIPQCSTKTHPYVAAICTKAAVDLLDKNENIDDLSRNAFRMLNVSHLVIPSQQRVHVFKNTTPAIFAIQAIPGRSDYTKLESETWASVRPNFEQRSLDYSVTEDIVEKMQIQSRKPIAHTIIMHSSLTQRDLSLLNSGASNTGTAEFAILKSHESHTYFKMEYVSSVQGVVQLSYSYFPYLKAKIDGKPVETYPSALGLLVLRAPAGRHTIFLKAGVSPLRIKLLIFGAAGTFVLVIFSLSYSILRKSQRYKTMTKTNKCAANKGMED